MQKVNIIKRIQPKDIVEGQAYHYLRKGAISKGDAVQCEECGKWCTVNSVGIASFGVDEINIEIAEITDQELTYNEELDKCVCEDCN